MTTCNRCGGQHHAHECLIQDVVVEIEAHDRLHGPATVDGIRRHLEKNLGVSPEIAAQAVTRWGGA